MAETRRPTAHLSTTDKLLPVLILFAMATGLFLGRFVPSLGEALHSFTIGTVSIPIALGLLVMMYPPLAQVRYDKAYTMAYDGKLMAVTVLLNWVLGPALMFTLAWVCLPDQPGFRTGVIIIGLARCIAMVLIWNDLGHGCRETAAVLVALNSIFQILAFSFLGWFYLQILPGWLGLDSTSVHFSFWDIAKSVLIFLGIPLFAGAASRILGEKLKSRTWYETTFLPVVSPWALRGLLFTIIILFALQGEHIQQEPSAVARVAVPLVLYFVIMYVLGLLLSRGVGFAYDKSTAVAFTAAGNNFELAIAVTIGAYGATSREALAGTIGPLIEVPVLVALVFLGLFLKPKLFPSSGACST